MECMAGSYRVEETAKFQDWKNNLPENASWRKGISCIPVIGFIATLVIESSLKSQLLDKASKFGSNNLTDDFLIAEITELVNIKNHYKVSSMVRTILTVAALVVGVAALVLVSNPIGAALTGLALTAGITISTGLAIAGGGLAAGTVGIIGFHTYGRYKNQQQLEDNKTIPYDRRFLPQNFKFY